MNQPARVYHLTRCAGCRTLARTYDVPYYECHACWKARMAKLDAECEEKRRQAPRRSWVVHVVVVVALVVGLATALWRLL